MSDTIDIEYVARLARITLTPEEKAGFSAQLGQILDYMERLGKVDVEGIEPTAHAFAMENVWADDEAAEPFSVDEALRNAPAAREDQIVVPKVVEDAGSA